MNKLEVEGLFEYYLRSGQNSPIKKITVRRKWNCTSDVHAENIVKYHLQKTGAIKVSARLIENGEEYEITE